jgi:hypothetical protein
MGRGGAQFAANRPAEKAEKAEKAPSTEGADPFFRIFRFFRNPFRFTRARPVDASPSPFAASLSSRPARPLADASPGARRYPQ